MTHIRNILIGGVLLASCPIGVANAQESSGFVDAFLRLMEFSGYEIRAKSIEVDGDNIVLDRVRVRLENSSQFEELDLPFDAGQPLSVPGPITFTNVRQNADGNYEADRMDLSPISFEADEATISIGEFLYEDLVISTSDPISIIDLMLVARKSTIGPITVDIDGIPAVAIAPMVSINNFEPSQSAALQKITSSFSIPAIQVFLENSPNPMDELAVVLFGEENFSGSVSGLMTWDLETGRMTYESFELVGDDMGKFTFTFDMSGFTPELIDQLMAISRDADYEDPEFETEMMELGMGMLARSFFYSMTFRYDDFGAADRFFSYVEEDEGMSRAEMIEELTEELAGTLDVADSPELKAQIIEAATSFVLNPQSIEIRIEPETPLPAISFLGLAATPAVLVETLGVSVTANQGG